MTTGNPELPPVKIAFVIDGVIVDVLRTDDRLASIFLSNPTIVDATEWIDSHPGVQLVNGFYDGENFIPPTPEE